jgi:hypothetical protein
MGGGKTHSMIALGLLSAFPALRSRFWKGKNLGDQPIRVIGFDGRESDYPFGLWGAIADQLGKKEQFAQLYSPLQPPGVTSWINLLKGPPVIILLDELPPYFIQAQGKVIGDTNLAELTTTSLSNLMVAANKDELSNVVIVLSDLSGSAYDSGNMVKALDNLQQETNRSALPLEPVATQGEEVYHILRTRLFESLPGAAVIDGVASAYAESVKKAKQMDLTAASPESFAAELRESYPFHFSLRDLYGRFKANPGFQQTRGLLRLMRAIVANLWETKKAEQISLIHPYDIDLNDQSIYSEFVSINSSLTEAIRLDLANNGNSHAEQLDIRLGSGQAAQDAAKLIFVSSLSAATSAIIGLRDTEAIAWLCAPGKDIARLRTDILEQLPNTAWYLHLSNDGRLYFKNVQNLAAKLHGMVGSYTDENKIQELRRYLDTMFRPSLADLYQELRVLPALDDCMIQPGKVLLILTDPYPGATPQRPLQPEWIRWYEELEFKNRVLFLTGDRDTMQEVLKNAAFFKAIQVIMAEQESEGLTARDPQRAEAQRSFDKISLSLRSAVQQTFSQLVYPSRNGLRLEPISFIFENNNYNPENQIRKTMEDVGKFSSEKAQDSWIKKVEDRLFDGQNPVPWADVKKRAAVKPDWQWHHRDLLEDIRSLALSLGTWRDEGGSIRRGPFQKDATQVRITVKSRNEDSGEAVLEIKPVGGTKVLYEIGDVEPGEAAEHVPSYNDFITKELLLSFVCIDEGADPAPTGPHYVWRNQIGIKGRDYMQGNDRFFELRSYPEGVPIRYTTNGNDPLASGVPYEGPFLLPPATRLVQAVAEKNGMRSPIFSMPIGKIDEWRIDPNAPATWKTTKRFLNRPKSEAFQVLNRMQEFQASADSLTLLCYSSQTGEEIQYTLPEGVRKTADDLITMWERLTSLLPSCEATLSIQRIYFQSGQHLMDWQSKDKLAIDRNEVQQ